MTTTRTRFSEALTEGLLTARPLSAREMRHVLATIAKEPCTRTLSSGSYGTTRRACQVLEMPGGTGSTDTTKCTDCFVYKRAREAGDLQPAEAELQATLTRQLSRRHQHSHGHAHIPRFILSRPDLSFPKVKGRDQDVLLFMDDIKPLVWHGKPAATLNKFACRDESRLIPDLVWRGVWLQIVGTLADLADAVPGFQHNDLHAGNILMSPSRVHVCAWQRPDGTPLRMSSPVLATLIDFGMASSAQGFPEAAAHLKQYNKCALLDLHHAAAHIFAFWKYHAMKAGNTTSDEFVAWLPAWFPPWLDMLRRQLGRAALKTELWDDYDFPTDKAVIADLKLRSAALTHGMRDVLDDPYFDAFARPKGSTPQLTPPRRLCPHHEPRVSHTQPAPRPLAPSSSAVALTCPLSRPLALGGFAAQSKRQSQGQDQVAVAQGRQVVQAEGKPGGRGGAKNQGHPRITAEVASRSRRQTRGGHVKWASSPLAPLALPACPLARLRPCRPLRLPTCLAPLPHLPTPYSLAMAAPPHAHPHRQLPWLVPAAPPLMQASEPSLTADALPTASLWRLRHYVREARGMDAVVPLTTRLRRADWEQLAAFLLAFPALQWSDVTRAGLNLIDAKDAWRLLGVPPAEAHMVRLLGPAALAALGLVHVEHAAAVWSDPLPLEHSCCLSLEALRRRAGRQAAPVAREALVAAFNAARVAGEAATASEEAAAPATAVWQVTDEHLAFLRALYPGAPPGLPGINAWLAPLRIAFVRVPMYTRQPPALAGPITVTTALHPLTLTRLAIKFRLPAGLSPVALVRRLNELTASPAFAFPDPPLDAIANATDAYLTPFAEMEAEEYVAWGALGQPATYVSLADLQGWFAEHDSLAVFADDARAYNAEQAQQLVDVLGAYRKRLRVLRPASPTAAALDARLVALSATVTRLRAAALLALRIGEANVARLRALPDSEREDVLKFLRALHELAAYCLHWRGPGTPWPTAADKVVHTPDAEAIIYERAVPAAIDAYNALSGDLREALAALPLYEERDVPSARTLKAAVDALQAASPEGRSCIRLFARPAWRSAVTLSRELFNVTLPPYV